MCNKKVYLLAHLQSSILFAASMCFVEVTGQLAGYYGVVWLPATVCSTCATELTIFSPRLTAMLRPGNAMMSILLNSERARSTVGTSSNEMVTAPKHGMVSTRGFSVILAQAFSCRVHKAQHEAHVPLQSRYLQRHAPLCCTTATSFKNVQQLSETCRASQACCGWTKLVDGHISMGKAAVCITCTSLTSIGMFMYMPANPTRTDTHTRALLPHWTGTSNIASSATVSYAFTPPTARG